MKGRVQKIRHWVLGWPEFCQVQRMKCCCRCCCCCCCCCRRRRFWQQRHQHVGIRPNSLFSADDVISAKNIVDGRLIGGWWIAKDLEGSGSGLIEVLKKQEGEELRIAGVPADILTRHVALPPYRKLGIDSWVEHWNCSVCRRIPNVYGAYCATFVGGGENQSWVWTSRSIYTFGAYTQRHTSRYYYYYYYHHHHHHRRRRRRRRRHCHILKILCVVLRIMAQACRSRIILRYY